VRGVGAKVEVEVIFVLNKIMYRMLNMVWIPAVKRLKDPQWPYRFPLASVHPEDHKKFTSMRYAEYFANQAGRFLHHGGRI
jgi:hypothetical protein